MRQMHSLGTCLAVGILLAFSPQVSLSQDLPSEEPAAEVALITGEVIEVDADAGVIVVHVEAVDDLEVEHFDLEIWIDEETILENESDWDVESAIDLEGTLVDVEGFMDGDLFIADTVWIVEGPVEEEPPVDTVST